MSATTTVYRWEYSDIQDKFYYSAHVDPAVSVCVVCMHCVHVHVCAMYVGQEVRNVHISGLQMAPSISTQQFKSALEMVACNHSVLDCV